MANERLRPFRDYSEHDVLNLFAFGDVDVILNASTVVYAGSCVKVKTGWSNSNEPSNMIGDVGASYNNTVSQRWGVTADVQYTDGGADEAALGITLYDVREYDENGEALKFNPRKQDELQCSLNWSSSSNCYTRSFSLWQLVHGLVQQESCRIKTFSLQVMAK